MMHLQPDRRATALATLASALVGSGLLALLLFFYWPRPIIVWMRIIVPRGVDPAATGVTSNIAAIFMVALFLFAVAVSIVRWVLRQLGVFKPATALAVILALAFVLSFAAEAMSQMASARGNLTASDATGLIIEDARLTAHGWETIARRAAAASFYACVMAVAFWLVSFVSGRRHGPH